MGAGCSRSDVAPAPAWAASLEVTARLRARFASTVDPAEWSKGKRRGVAVRALRQLARRHGNLTLREFVDQIVIPNTLATGKRFCNTLGKGNAEAFLSVPLGATLKDTAAAVSSVLADNVYVLTDFASCFQLPPVDTTSDIKSVRPLSEMREKAAQDYVNLTHAVTAVEKLVSVTITRSGDESAYAWRRLWCIQELARACAHGKKVAMVVGQAAAHGGEFVPNVEVARKAIGNVRVLEAKCDDPNERIALLDDVEQTGEGVEAVEEFIDKALQRAVKDMRNQLNDITLWLYTLEDDLGHSRRYVHYAPTFIENFASLVDVAQLNRSEISQALDACGVHAFGDRKHLTKAISELAHDPRFATANQNGKRDDSDAMQGSINDPGKWDFFISYTQRNASGMLVAHKMYHMLKEEGCSVWLDNEMADKSEAAMKEGILGSSCVIVVVSDVYLTRDFCLKELRWAKGAFKCIQPVVHVSDKSRIGELVQQGPADVQFLRSIDFVDLNMSDKEYLAVGVKKVLRNLEVVAGRTTPELVAPYGS